MEKIELLIRKNALKDVEVWLYQQYAEIDKQLEYLDAKEDKIKEVADEVRGEL
jgi:hypothetical protein